MSLNKKKAKNKQTKKKTAVKRCIQMECIQIKTLCKIQDTADVPSSCSQ